MNVGLSVGVAQGGHNSYMPRWANVSLALVRSRKYQGTRNQKKTCAPISYAGSRAAARRGSESCKPLIFLGFSLLPRIYPSSRFELPGCLTPIACEAGQERLRLILSWGALPFVALVLADFLP